MFIWKYESLSNEYEQFYFKIKNTVTIDIVQYKTI